MVSFLPRRSLISWCLCCELCLWAFSKVSAALQPHHLKPETGSLPVVLPALLFPAGFLFSGQSLTRMDAQCTVIHIVIFSSFTDLLLSVSQECSESSNAPMAV